MRAVGQWRAVHEAVLERIHRDQPGLVLFRLKVTLYPMSLWMEDPNDKCSACRRDWQNVDGAMAHAHGLPHFRNWCVEHPDQVRTRFPEAVKLTAEATLKNETEVRV